MIAHAIYLGFYPLGSDVELNGVKIMQNEWLEVKIPLFVFGKSNVVSPMFSYPFYVIDKSKKVFFLATEYGIGKYHIFRFTDSSENKLEKIIAKRFE